VKENDRIRSYAKQRGLDPVGAFKNGTSKKKLVGKLTRPQQRRLSKKTLVSV
jgi:hypothetical protein